MSVDVPTLLSTEDLFDFPDDGMDRELIDGQLWERPMTTRNPAHSETEINIGTALRNWTRTRPDLRLRVLGGEAGFRLRRNPDTTVGIDVAVASLDLPAVRIKGKAFLDGLPLLAVEILSPSDTHEEVTRKTRGYLDAGVPLVWRADPDFRFLLAFRPGEPPQLFTDGQELTAEPLLPGFRVPVAELFPI